MLFLFAFQATQNPRWQAAQSKFFSGRHPYSGVFWGKLVLYIVATGCIMLYPYVYTLHYTRTYLYIYIIQLDFSTHIYIDIILCIYIYIFVYYN